MNEVDAPLRIEPTFDRHLADGWRRAALIAEARSGFAARPLRMTPRWLYDARGSELFDQITRLPEYYPTEAERSILVRVADEIAERSGADTVVELGSGTSDKTRTLLDAFAASGQLRRFVPLDVSEPTLRTAANELADRYPGMAIHGVVGDFHEHLHHLPRDGRPLLTFLGSTIGNFYPPERARFFGEVAAWMPEGGSMLLGVDLVKPVDRLMAAYNDPRGVTAAFTLNLLQVLNGELGADFEPDRYEHVALWDPVHTRVDLRLRSLADQRVTIPAVELSVAIRCDEELRVEISTKFTVARIERELSAAGIAVEQVWRDEADDFALLFARRA